MAQPSTQKPAVRLGKGQKRTKKQAAVVTGLDAMSPDPRTPQAVVAALLDNEHPRSTARPVPVGTELRATLAGKADAMSRLPPRVAQHEGPHIQPRVALTAGAKPLATAAGDRLSRVHLDPEPHPCHRVSRDEANALLGENHPQRLAWVRAYLEALLAGQTGVVITALEAEGRTPRVRSRHSRRSSRRWATIDGTGRTCATIE